MDRVHGGSPIVGFVWSLLFLTAVSAGFFIVGALGNHSMTYWYLLWNLFLAWVPLMLAFLLLKTSRRQRWSSWPSIALTLLWLGFLPNSFYMVSDYIHLQDVQRVSLVYDVVMFTSFILTSLLLGFTSLYLVHRRLMEYLKPAGTWGWIGGILLLCSFAIYLGRDLRWNTWDIFFNPGGLLFDVSDQLLNPRAHTAAFTTTLTFFVFLGSVYIVVWRLVRTLQPHLLYTSKDET